MVLFPPADQNFYRLSREDVNHPLSSFSKHDFFLDDKQWPSVEHYFQAARFVDENYKEKIRQAEHPRIAQKLGKTRFKKTRGDWAKVQDIVMTRAVYIKCRSHPEVAQTLLETDDQKILETSAFDYYWGCGRDGRGKNAYGKVLMNVRDKLRQEAEPQSQSPQNPDQASQKNQE